MIKEQENHLRSSKEDWLSFRINEAHLDHAKMATVEIIGSLETDNAKKFEDQLTSRVYATHVSDELTVARRQGRYGLKVFRIKAVRQHADLVRKLGVSFFPQCQHGIGIGDHHIGTAYDPALKERIEVTGAAHLPAEIVPHRVAEIGDPADAISFFEPPCGQVGVNGWGSGDHDRLGRFLHPPCGVTGRSRNPDNARIVENHQSQGKIGVDRQLSRITRYFARYPENVALLLRFRAGCGGKHLHGMPEPAQVLGKTVGSPSSNLRIGRVNIGKNQNRLASRHVQLSMLASSRLCPTGYNLSILVKLDM